MRIVNILNYFLRVANVHLDLLSEIKQCFMHQVLEEWQVLEDLLVRLLQKLSLQAVRQILHEQVLLFVVELLLYVRRLLDVIVDPPLQILRDVVLP